jgi:hypothetical protein
MVSLPDHTQRRGDEARPAATAGDVHCLLFQASRNPRVRAALFASDRSRRKAFEGPLVIEAAKRAFHFGGSLFVSNPPLHSPQALGADEQPSRSGCEQTPDL